MLRLKLNAVKVICKDKTYAFLIKIYNYVNNGNNSFH